MKDSRPFKVFLNLFKLSLLSQILMFASIPLVMVFYSPDVFGLFTIIISISTLLGMVSSWKIERALVIEDDVKLKCILKYCIVLVIFNSMLCSIFICIFLKIFFPEARIVFILVIVSGAYCFLTGISQLLAHLAMRIKKVKLIGFSDLYFSLILIILLIYNPGQERSAISLLLIYTCSKIISLIPYQRLNVLKQIEEFGYERVHIKELSNYILSMITVILSNLQFRGMYYLSGVYFGNAVTGTLSLSHRVVYSPINLIGASLRKAYFKEFVSLEGESTLKEQVYKIIIYGCLISFLIFPLFSLGLIYITDWIPSEWGGITKYIQILYPAASILLLLSWLDRVYDAFKLQKRALMYEIYYTLILYTLLVVLLLCFNKILWFLITYTIITVLYNLFWAYKTFNLLSLDKSAIKLLSLTHLVLLVYIIIKFK